MMPEARRILVGQMLALLVVTALVAGGSAPSPAPPTAIGAVPDEPDAFVLPDERATYQAVAADIDGDGIRELVRLIAGPESSLLVEAWHEVAGGWAQAAEPAEVGPSILPGAGGIGGDPVRLVVRSVAGRDRVTVVRQPLRDEPGLDEPCCLRLDDLVLEGGSLDVRRLAASLSAADTIHPVDFDGDGPDQLLIPRAIPTPGSKPFRPRLASCGGPARPSLRRPPPSCRWARVTCPSSSVTVTDGPETRRRSSARSERRSSIA